MPEVTPQIIAMGGGGFSMEPDNPALDRFVLEQTPVSRPRVCFLATASGDASRYLADFYAAFSRLDCRPSHLPLFARTPDLRRTLAEQDVIYVGGGNTRSMLAVWREWGLDELLRERYLAGAILAGISAGAICWFEQGISDSAGAQMMPLDCLGYLPESCCPHFDGEAERRPAYHRLIAKGRVGPGYALDDGAAVHFRNGHLVEAVASRPAARAYQVGSKDGAVQEVVLPTRFLG